MNINTSDNILINAYRLNNPKGLDVLIKKYRNDVYSFINSKINDKDVSDDIFQETFIKVILALRNMEYTENGRFLFWVLRIANNQIMDYFRLANKRHLLLKIENNCLLNNLLINESSDVDEMINFERNYFIIKRLINDKLLPEQTAAVGLPASTIGSGFIVTITLSTAVEDVPVTVNDPCNAVLPETLNDDTNVDALLKLGIAGGFNIAL
jgi:RNA polymerase sigma-70 factor (ECF subfamily)